MLDARIYERWLERYLVPQMSRDAELVKELFAEGAVYEYGPYYPCRRGVEAIYEHHRHALSHQFEIKYTWRVLAVTDAFALAWFDLTLRDEQPGEPDAYQGILKITLNADGKCTHFEEWYNVATR